MNEVLILERLDKIIDLLETQKGASDLVTSKELMEKLEIKSPRTFRDYVRSKKLVNYGTQRNALYSLNEMKLATIESMTPKRKKQ